MSASPDGWRAVIAALRDDDVRAVLGETAPAALTPRRRERAHQRLIALGLVVDDGDGIRFDDAPLRDLLSTAPRPHGPERFLDRDGRIDRYPAQAADRLAVLRHVAGRAFSPDTVLSERDVNERLEPYAPNGDVAVLRRYLVDHGLLRRTASGSEYVLTHE
ncbi:DUF2087 domain-containing protein [uncultured Microbacterium sp.]|uniref:DUF2087 domain-containing protein n=1 Tax=uncultured Microbacterium sp. TaxID=191216 RepID=UPI0025FB38BD|nr:DUF2087 domain-containing protein [uncultured Microbacterium sp.]